MEINEQLFEDVLSGKLKGTFVFRNQVICSSDELTINTNGTVPTYPYKIKNRSYTSNGTFNLNIQSIYDIVNFIPDMKENELTIEIPNGKIARVEHIDNKINVTFEDKKLVKIEIIKHYNDGSIEIEERT